MERLTYRNGGVAYLKYGLDAVWRKMKGYNIIVAAIQKLAEYEDCMEEMKQLYDNAIETMDDRLDEGEMKNKSTFDIHELIEDSMAKKDRYITIYVGKDGLSVDVYPLVENVGLENEQCEKEMKQLYDSAIRARRGRLDEGSDF